MLVQIDLSRVSDFGPIVQALTTQFTVNAMAGSTSKVTVKVVQPRTERAMGFFEQSALSDAVRNPQIVKKLRMPRAVATDPEAVTETDDEAFLVAMDDDGACMFSGIITTAQVRSRSHPC